MPGELLGSGLVSWMSGPQKVEGGRIVVQGLSPGEERRVVVRFDEQKLIGTTTLKADEDGPFEVKLVPWSTLKGRLVDADGKPRSKGLTIKLRDHERLPVYAKGCEGYSSKPSNFLVDGDGRFSAEALLPGQPYQVEIVEGRLSIIDYAAKDVVLRAGEAKDLGDVAVKKP